MSEKKNTELGRKALNDLLPKEVAEKFEILMERRTSSTFIVKEGKFDLTKITLAQCEALVAQKANWIRAKSGAQKSADGSSKA